MRSRRVAVVIPNLVRGGAERMVVDLVNELVSCKELKVTLISLYRNDDMGFVNDIDKRVELIELNKRLGFSVGVLFSLFIYVLKWRPDIIHTHLSALDYVLPVKIVLPWIRVVHTVHSDARYEASRWVRLFRAFFYLTGLVRAVAISENGVNSFVSVYRTRPTLIENGRSNFAFNFSEIQSLKQQYKMQLKYDYVFLNIGRIELNKNQLELARAIVAVRASGVNCILLLAGRIEDQDLYAQVQDLANANPGAIEYIGVLEDVSSYMYVCDAFLLSSYIEGMPMTILEAMSIPKIVVSTPAGGVPNMIENEVTGFISGGFDATALTEAINRYVSCSKKEEMLVVIRSVFHRKYTMKVCAQNYQNTYF